MRYGGERREHTAKCRKRILGEMEKDEKGKKKMQAAEERLQRELARRLEEEDNKEIKEKMKGNGELLFRVQNSLQAISLERKSTVVKKMRIWEGTMNRIPANAEYIYDSLNAVF